VLNILSEFNDVRFPPQQQTLMRTDLTRC